MAYRQRGAGMSYPQRTQAKPHTAIADHDIELGGQLDKPRARAW